MEVAWMWPEGGLKVAIKLAGPEKTLFWKIKPCSRKANTNGGEAYNGVMNYLPLLHFKATVFTCLFAVPSLCAAQTPPAAAGSAIAPIAQPAQPSRGDQVIRKIRIEDAGSRIDEVRVGGQTQSITVQPKTGLNVPAYEIKPSDTGRGAAPSSSNGDTAGSRVWNVLKF